MPEVMEETQEFESSTVGIYRTAATVKGGRRFSFSALVIVGDRSGRVGIGYGKANQVPSAIEKAQKEARRRAKPFPMQGRTLPHSVTGRFGSCEVRLIPASPGTGVIAGAAVRTVLEMLGVHDCLTKSLGSNNPKNLVKAVLDGLSHLRSKETVMELRGVTLESTAVEDAIERGQAFMPQSSGEKMAAPVSTVGDKRGDKSGRKGRGRGRGKPRRSDSEQTETRTDSGGDAQEAKKPIPEIQPVDQAPATSGDAAPAPAAEPAPETPKASSEE